DSNYNETFWEPVAQIQKDAHAILVDRTKKTPYNVPVFTLATGMNNSLYTTDNSSIQTQVTSKERKLSEHAQIVLQKEKTLVIEKIATQVSSLHYTENELSGIAKMRLATASQKGFEMLYKEHTQAWENKWKLSDIRIEGDVAAQQGIRFSIFQLQQTYTG